MGRMFFMLVEHFCTSSPKPNCCTLLTSTFPQVISVFQGVMPLLLASQNYSNFSFSFFFFCNGTKDIWLLAYFLFHCTSTSCLSFSLLPLNKTFILQAPLMKQGLLVQGYFRITSNHVSVLDLSKHLEILLGL